MHKITAIIIDDEANSRAAIKNLLTALCPNISIIGEAKNADLGIALIDEIKPQLVFLDIQMPGKTGFDLLASISKINFDVIFTTAYHEYAIKAFKFSAIDYLLKPIDPDDLVNAVQKVTEKHSQTNINQVDLLKQLWQQFSINNSYNNTQQKIALNSQEGIAIVTIQDIVWCESLGSYTKFHLQNGDKKVVSKPIKDYDEILAEYNFFRINKTFVINMNHIKKYIKGDGGMVIMCDNAELEVSRRRKDEFIDIFNKNYVK